MKVEAEPGYLKLQPSNGEGFGEHTRSRQRVQVQRRAWKDSSWIQTMDLLLKSAEDPIAAILALEQPYYEAQARKEAGESALGDAEILDEGRQLEHFRDLAVAISAILKENVLVFPKEIAEKVKATRQALSSYGTGVFERTKGIAELPADARPHQ